MKIKSSYRYSQKDKFARYAMMNMNVIKQLMKDLIRYVMDAGITM